MRWRYRDGKGGEGQRIGLQQTSALGTLAQAVTANIPHHFGLLPQQSKLPQQSNKGRVLLHQQAIVGTPDPTAMTLELKRMPVTLSEKIHFAMVQMGQETLLN